MFVDASECLELQSDDCLSSPAIILNVLSLPAHNVSVSKNLRSLNAPRFIYKVSFSAANIAARLFVAHLNTPKLTAFVLNALPTTL